MQTWWIKLGDIFHWIPELREALEEIDMELLNVEDYSDTDYEPHNRFKCDVIGSGFIFHFRDARDIYIVTDDNMMLMARDLPEMLFVHRIYFVNDDGRRGEPDGYGVDTETELHFAPEYAATPEELMAKSLRDHRIHWRDLDDYSCISYRGVMIPNSSLHDPRLVGLLADPYSMDPDRPYYAILDYTAAASEPIRPHSEP